MRSDGSALRRDAGRLALHLTQSPPILTGAATGVPPKTGHFSANSLDLSADAGNDRLRARHASARVSPGRLRDQVPALADVADRGTDDFLEAERVSEAGHP